MFFVCYKSQVSLFTFLLNKMTRERGELLAVSAAPLGFLDFYIPLFLLQACSLAVLTRSHRSSSAHHNNAATCCPKVLRLFFLTNNEIQQQLVTSCCLKLNTILHVPVIGSFQCCTLSFLHESFIG